VTVGALTLVLGGARSGKSAFAERLAASRGDRVLYLATARAVDSEMEERIRLHQQRRPSTWCTVEAPTDPASALASGDRWDAILLDSVTLWISNIYGPPDGVDENPTAAELARAEREAHAGVVRLLARQRELEAELILVSDEAGLGVVPATGLGRNFRDLLGTINQELAGHATQVTLVVAGLPLVLKTAP
jgi:adenosylcobinamide kinase / adenosylcobinamide-phosphate guanylyltransferase